MVRFLVKKDGSISDFKALNDPGYGLATKVIDIMKDSPKWNPAIQNGKIVNSYHTPPITFVIEEQKRNDANTLSGVPKIKLEDLKRLDHLNISNVVSFTLSADLENGDLKVYTNRTSKFDPTTRSILAEPKPGALLSFERIVAKENNVEIKKPSLIYQVVE